jgi:deazaflavin-dependent oxidoreductase (nitroreductase family)
MAQDWNARVIEEFRANAGRVGGQFEGAPLALVHHTGRRSGTERVSPVMYLPGEGDTVYVFATKGGAPESPDWYYNLTSRGLGSIELGADSYPVTVSELQGEERDRVYAEQASRYPAFRDYAERTKGIRTIPVLALRRVT